jgi:Helix-turn-helix domain of resolvase
MAKLQEDPCILDLEDKLKLAERRADEMRKERDEANNLVTRMEEHVKSARELIDSWIYAFDMQLGDDGMWGFDDRKRDAIIDAYIDLVRRWNKLVPSYNAIIRKNPVGRPLAASEAQIAQVRKLAKRGMSIRAIMIETNLGMQTVRTILDKDDRIDRTSKKIMERIDYRPVRDMAASAHARKRTRDALSTKINETIAEGNKLLNEAKGIA